MNGEQATFLVDYFANMLEMEGKTTANVPAIYGGSVDQAMATAD